ncbi:hypothetical protein LVY72_04870 [Arthrobacter sp. I2-34]|uniref:Acyl-CoA dehydrogenase/oxidase C-terminal domain-containing protein n=1 Tax=Arthrobacter hankyongi TaxID=2904801 RepID=A0ABS9L3I3_9MICC|nr:acyl-CoA dehydrogenase family protein [Arthrobacter hankyongi]MCG2621244.1 hypothetical protein [Arthrobacter hankyongi]
MDEFEKQAFSEGLAKTIDSTPAAQLREALEEFGWLDLLDEEPAEAAGIVFPLLGEHLVALPLLDDVCTKAAGLEPGPDTAFVYPALSSPVPTSTATLDGGILKMTLRGIVAARDAAPETVVAPVLLDGEPALVAGPWEGTWPAAGQGIDAESGWAQLDANWSVPAGAVVASGEPGTAWTAVRAAGHLALAFKMNAVGAAMLRLAVEHTASREQFGQRLSGFQVVRHKLADVRVWQETASLAADAAEESTDVLSCLLAKTLAGRFLRTARENCQQLLGGMGFTQEHDFHRYLRRALVLENLLGSTGSLRAELGSSIRAARSVPRLATL